MTSTAETVEIGALSGALPPTPCPARAARAASAPVAH